MPGAGVLRHRVDVQAPPSPDVPQDAYGEPSAAWTTEATRWMAVDPVAGGEVWRGQQVAADTTHAVVLRYYSGLTPAKRFKWGTRILNISKIRTPREVKDWMFVEAKEAV